MNQMNQLNRFLKNCIEARDYLLGIYMFRCIWDVLWITWLFLCFLVTGYAFFMGIIELVDGRDTGVSVFAIAVMLTCSSFMLKNILVSSKNSTL